MNTTPNTDHRPEILAPAGDRDCFLAAVSAGADAVYCGLKHFSARMEAANFSVVQVADLTRLAHDHGARVYVPMNVMAKSGETAAAGRLVDRLVRAGAPDALIMADPGLVRIARQAGFTGPIHLSTLANVSHPAGLAAAAELGVSRVILPRELSIDEIKACARACPRELGLELFVHGALCYGVSGRCWWSSYLGGKSGLRGRCVQPCRRVYTQKGEASRLFACQDLGLDVLAKTLLPVEAVKSWKIEGRKKGPHYVFYTVTAYRMLRDDPDNPDSRKAAQDLLDQALSRPTTHYSFLPQRTFTPVDPARGSGSGRQVAASGKGSRGRFTVKPRESLFAGDLLRVGYEDQVWHQTVRVRRDVPGGGRLDVSAPRGAMPGPGTPVFLIDRREPELAERIRELGRELDARPAQEPGASDFVPLPPRPYAAQGRARDTTVRRRPSDAKPGDGVWVRPGIHEQVKAKLRSAIWWWLPPVVWPDEEDQLTDIAASILQAGGRRFMAGAPWQTALLGRALGRPDLAGIEVWAGPFCNLANPYAVSSMADLGFSGCFASPELPGEKLLALPGDSPLPLGIVVAGYWPLTVSRTRAVQLVDEIPLASPKKEAAWTKQYGQNTWVFPGWPLDIQDQAPELVRAGYRMLARLDEPLPKAMPRPSRTSRFNWQLKLV
jgi:putative protease